MAENRTNEEETRKLESLMKKSDHLGMFGTMVSLVSMLPYFIEEYMNKKLPRWLNIATLTAVGAGIAAMAGAVLYRLKAGRIAIHSTIYPQSIASPAPAPPESQEISQDKTPAAPTQEKQAASKNWVAQSAAPRSEAPAEMQR